MKPVLNLYWGDPIIVREALTDTLRPYYFPSGPPLKDLGYPEHNGNPKLIDQMKVLSERQSGHRPKHLFVTCGATGAINAALHALKNHRTGWVVANKRFFPLYPQIISMADMVMIDRDKKKFLTNKSNGCTEANFISLVDSPSNPEGSVCPLEGADIWDSAYASKTYSSSGHVPKKWKVSCGSLSKTLGLAGLRLGWISTDDSSLADSISSYITTHYAGLSSVSMKVAEDILDTLDLHKFEVKSSGYLDDNRETMQRLLDRFGQGDVSPRGMFALLQLGKAERKALVRANIKWLPGNMWGEDESWARLSLGQSREIVRAAVKGALK